MLLLSLQHFCSNQDSNHGALQEMVASFWLSGGIGLNIMLQLIEHRCNFLPATTGFPEDNVKLLALEDSIDTPIGSRLTMSSG